MKNFILSTETACDLNQELIDNLNLSVLPMNYYIDGTEYSSKTSSLSTTDICNMMRNGAKTKTSQPNEAEIETYLTTLLQQGKDILHISFSSAMSGTYNSFAKIAEKLNCENEHKIYVVDSLCQSSGLGLLLTFVNDEACKNGLSAEQAKQFADKIKLNIVHFFIVDDLKYLARGGRISPTLATIGNIIKLKPILHLNTNGAIVQHHKVLGRKKSISELLTYFTKHFNNQSNRVFICQADCLGDAEKLQADLTTLNPDLEVSIMELGSVIVSHSGPGTMAIFFTADERK